jgi:hypothetical protein
LVGRSSVYVQVLEILLELLRLCGTTTELLLVPLLVEAGLETCLWESSISLTDVKLLLLSWPLILKLHLLEVRVYSSTGVNSLIEATLVELMILLLVVSAQGWEIVVREVCGVIVGPSSGEEAVVVRKLLEWV